MACDYIFISQMLARLSCRFPGMSLKQNTISLVFLREGLWKWLDIIKVFRYRFWESYEYYTPKEVLAYIKEVFIISNDLVWCKGHLLYLTFWLKLSFLYVMLFVSRIIIDGYSPFRVWKGSNYCNVMAEIQ